MSTHSSSLAWKIPWTEEPGGLQSMGSQRVGHDQRLNQPPLCQSLTHRSFSELSFFRGVGAHCPKVNSLMGASLFIKRAFYEKKNRNWIFNRHYPALSCGFHLNAHYFVVMRCLLCLQYDTSRVLLGRKNKAKGQKGHIN